MSGFFYISYLLGLLAASTLLDLSFFQKGVLVCAGMISLQIVKKAWKRSHLPYCRHEIRGGEAGGECVECDRAVVRKIVSRRLYESEFDRLQKGRLFCKEVIKNMNPYEFETMVCNLYHAIGYNVTQTPRAVDGGRDAIMVRNGNLELLEVKLHASKIGRPAIQKFHSAMITDRATAGKFVAPGGFTRHAQDLALEVGIDLIDIDSVFELMRKVGWDTADTKHISYLCISCGHYGTIDIQNEQNCGHCNAELEHDFM